MSAFITSTICGVIMNISVFYIIKIITKSNEKIYKLKNILLLLALAIIYAVLYTEKYNITYTIINYLSVIICIKTIFKDNMTKTVISTILAMIIIIISDSLNSLLMMNFMSLETIRTSVLIRILNNLIVAIISISMISIKKINTKIKYFISRFEYKRIPVIMLMIILVLAILFLGYNISGNFNLNIENLSNILIVLTLVIFFYIFINENNQYNKLNDEYDNLFKCIQTFEDWIEKEQLNRHEYKNQLAVLRCMTKEKKVKEKIDSIISDNININNDTINQLKSIPSGGLKGLLYYKIVIAEKNKINLEIDVSLNKKNQLNKLSEEQMKIICRLIGIYFDNAIEAAIKTRKKIVSLEIYEYDNEVNIVISNTFQRNKDINRRNEKGFTTKGKGRGNGLYFAKKMINNNSWLNESQTIINNFYTQKLIIKK